MGGFHRSPMELEGYREGTHEYKGRFAFTGVWEGSVTIPMELACLCKAS